jgi:hypothetical protein
MTQNKIRYLKYHIIFGGVPARKLAVGLSAHSPRHARKTRLPAGYPLQSLTQSNSYAYDLPEMVMFK